MTPPTTSKDMMRVAVKKPSRSISLPREVLVPIFEEFVAMYQEDKEVRMLPLLLASRSIHNAVLPLFYHKVQITSYNQSALLPRASSNALCAMRHLVIPPCKPADPTHHLCRQGRDDPVQMRTLVDIWTSRLLRLGREGRSVELDTVDCLRVVGCSILAPCFYMNIRKFVYRPSNLDCPYINWPTKFVGETGRALMQFATDWDGMRDGTVVLDISWLLDPRIALDTDPFFGPSLIDNDQDTAISLTMGTYLSALWRAAAERQWRKKFGKTRRIKITCQQHPFVFWDRDEEHKGRYTDVFEFEKTQCYGPKERLHEILLDTCYQSVRAVGREAGKRVDDW